MTAVAVLLATAVEHAGRLGGGQPLGISFARVFAALAACLAVAALAILFVRQRRGLGGLSRWAQGLSRQAQAVHVVEVRRLGVHAEIGLVRHRGREYLLVMQAGGAQLLRDEAEPAIPQRAVVEVVR